MNKVFIAFADEYDYKYILGVFDTKEKCKQFCDEANSRNPEQCAIVLELEVQ